MSGEKTKLEELRAKLADLDRRREKLVAEIAALMESESAQVSLIHESLCQRARVGDETLSNARKIALFLRLFRGRDDVFLARWANVKSGRSGYSPVCANEWREGLCGKPRIKCSACPHQAFVPVSDEMIGRHLRGMKRNRTAPPSRWVFMFIHCCRTTVAGFWRRISMMRIGETTLRLSLGHADGMAFLSRWSDRVPAKARMPGSSSISRRLRPWRAALVPF